MVRMDAEQKTELRHKIEIIVQNYYSTKVSSEWQFM